jgi:hypothetical protein
MSKKLKDGNIFKIRKSKRKSTNEKKKVKKPTTNTRVVKKLSKIIHNITTHKPTKNISSIFNDGKISVGIIYYDNNKNEVFICQNDNKLLKKFMDKKIVDIDIKQGSVEIKDSLPKTKLEFPYKTEEIKNEYNIEIENAFYDEKIFKKIFGSHEFEATFKNKIFF